jgi:hypothetical protein
LQELRGVRIDKNSVICASCVLFGIHQKHDILSLKDGAKYLRDSVDFQIKKGNLKKEYTDGHLLEIREYHLRVDKFKNDTVKKIDELFKEITNALKIRKNEIITEILEKFTEEKNLIQAEENKWNDKQFTADRLLSLSRDKDDQNLLKNSKEIMDGIRILNEKISFKEIKVYNNIDTSLPIKREGTLHPLILSHEEIVHYLSHYLTICEPNILEYKS